MREEWKRGQRGFYIVGMPGNYTIKCCGNHRVLERDLPTLNDARTWLTTYYPGSFIYA